MSMTHATVDPRALEARGWTRRNVASEPRLGEIVETYRALGFEVKLVPVPVFGPGAAGASGQGCTACFSSDDDPGRHRIIYTRPRGTPER